MSLTVKAYLLKETATDEIRRFAVDQDVSTSHHYLREKIAQMFPTLRNSFYDLYWKDADNDMIAFSSDEEQTEALGFVTDGIFKVFIKEQAAKQGAEPGNDKIPHPGVVCDGCEGPVCGIRYKCVVCPDYDLCSTCKGKGLHPEHDMMSISTEQGNFMGFGFFPPPHHFHGHPPFFGHPHPSHHGPPPPPPPPPPFEEDMAEGHPPGSRGPWGPGPFGPWGGRGRGNWRHMRKCWKKWFEGDCQGKNKNNVSKNDKDREDENMEHEAKPKGSDDINSSSDDGNNSPTEEFLKNIGQNVAAMLDPLGIDVEIDVEHGGNSQRFDGPQHPFAQWNWANWTGRGRHCHGRGRGRCPRSSSTGGQPCPSAENKSEQEKPDEQKQKTDIEMETGEANEMGKTEDQPVNIAQYIVKTTPDTETGETGTGTKAMDGETSPDREWTLLDDQRSPAENIPGTDTEGATGIYPEVPQPTVPVPPTDPAIANALDHMRAMGFEDDGGWLTTLLQVTKGDINKALDAIRANRNVKK